MKSLLDSSNIKKGSMSKVRGLIFAIIFYSPPNWKYY